MSLNGEGRMRRRPLLVIYIVSYPAKVKQHHGWIRYNTTKRLSDSVVQSQR
jgi:hypothetical protein